MEQADCTAVSVTSLQLGDVNCRFTTKRLEEPGVLPGAATVNKQLTESAVFENAATANTRTFVKSMFAL